MAIPARRILAIPASSAPVEPLFSTAGLTISEKRTRLHSSTSDDLILLKQSWKKAEELRNCPDYNKKEKI